MTRWPAMFVVTAGVLATWGTGGSARAVDVDELPPGDTLPVVRPAEPSQPAPEKHYVEIPLGRHASSAPPKPSSDTAPEISPDVEALIQKLGDDDFRKREDAAAQLRTKGYAALPALKYARDTATDPEVVSRADATIQNIERPPVENSRRFRTSVDVLGRNFADPEFLPMAGNVPLQLRRDKVGRRRIEVREAGGRVVRIDENPDGIRVSITTKGDGENTVKEVNARTAEQLKAQSPEAFELYTRWSGRAGGAQWQRNALGAQPQHARVNEQQMRELVEEMRRRQAALRTGVPIPGDAFDPDADKLVRQADEVEARLRRFRQEALAEAEAAVQQPSGAKLGVTVYDDPRNAMTAERGTTIARVEPGSRAEQLGLKNGDVVTSINGRPVRRSLNLRPALLMAGDDSLTIEGLRDGKPFTLTEGKAPARKP